MNGYVLTPHVQYFSHILAIRAIRIKTEKKTIDKVDIHTLSLQNLSSCDTDLCFRWPHQTDSISCVYRWPWFPLASSTPPNARRQRWYCHSRPTTWHSPPNHRTLGPVQRPSHGFKPTLHSAFLRQCNGIPPQRKSFHALFKGVPTEHTIPQGPRGNNN